MIINEIKKIDINNDNDNIINEKLIILMIIIMIMKW